MIYGSKTQKEGSCKVSLLFLFATIAHMWEFELKLDTPLQQLLGRTKMTFHARSTTYLITYETEVHGFHFIRKTTHKYGDELNLEKYDKEYQRHYDKFVSQF